MNQKDKILKSMMSCWATVNDTLLDLRNKEINHSNAFAIIARRMKNCYDYVDNILDSVDREETKKKVYAVLEDMLDFASPDFQEDWVLKSDLDIDSDKYNEQSITRSNVLIALEDEFMRYINREMKRTLSVPYDILEKAKIITVGDLVDLCYAFDSDRTAQKFVARLLTYFACLEHKPFNKVSVDDKLEDYGMNYLTKVGYANRADMFIFIEQDFGIPIPDDTDKPFKSGDLKTIQDVIDWVEARINFNMGVV